MISPEHRATRSPLRLRVGRSIALRAGAAAAVSALAVLVTAPAASAHPYFLSSTPGPDVVLHSSPAQIDITFTEALDYPYSKVALEGPDQRVTPTHQVHAANPSTLAVVPSRPLTTIGTYVVGWTAVGEDGHTVTGSFAISIGHPTPRPDVTNDVATLGGTASGVGLPLGVLRAVQPVFAVTLAGLLLLAPVVAVAVQAGSRPGDDEGGRPPGPAEDEGEGEGGRPPGPGEGEGEGGGPPGEGEGGDTGAVPGIAGAKPGPTRRLAVVLWAAWSGLLVTLAALAWYGISAAAGLSGWLASASGRRLLAQLALVVSAAVIVLDPAGLRSGRKPDRLRWAWGALVAVAILFFLAASGHAESQPDSRRWLVIAVYAVHLVAVAVWAGALLAVLLPGNPRRLLAGAESGLRRLVSVAVAAVIVTGVADTAWGIRSLAQIGQTAYGRLIAAKVALYLTMVGLGAVAAGMVGRRSSVRGRLSLGRRSSVRGRLSLGRASLGRRLVVSEAGVGLVVLVLAGTLSQLPQPIDLPAASQLFAADTGLSLSVGASGGDLVVGTLSPGLPGSNRIAVQVDASDTNDFLQPVAGVENVSAAVTCGCGHDLGLVGLHPVAGGTWWAADVNLPVAATWSLAATVGYATGFGPGRTAVGSPTEQVQLVAKTLPGELPDQVVIGVPADLSGPEASRCQDRLAGLQVALEDVNARAQDDRRFVRVVAVDTSAGGVPAGMRRLHALHPVAIAMPCGTPGSVTEAIDQARAFGLPVVDDVASTGAPAGGVWSLGPNWTSEGRLLADQVHTEGAATVEVLAGATAVDRQELAATTAELSKLDVVFGVSVIPSDPARFATNLKTANPDAVIVIADPAEALPAVQAISTNELSDPWTPSRGLLASSQLMNTNFINAAGQVTRLGVMQFASDIDPFDPIDQYYAQRLRALVPGIRPTFDGLHGYIAALALATALRDGGGAPSPARLAQLLGTRFETFALGSYQASWNRQGGSASELSFFRSTYINPLAMPSNTPGGAASMGHEGTFLDSGGFEQVAPFVKVATS